MAVYVDKGRNPYRGMIMSHMLADTATELHAMAARVGLKRAWFQPGSTPHYDLCQAKRRLAIAAGAIEIDRKQLGELIRRLRAQRLENVGHEKERQADSRQSNAQRYDQPGE